MKITPTTACKCALSALTQNRVCPADVALAVSVLRDAILEDDRKQTAMVAALRELVAEHDAEPWGHEGPWYGRNDTGGIVLARQALAMIEG